MKAVKNRNRADASGRPPGRQSALNENLLSMAFHIDEERETAGRELKNRIDEQLDRMEQNEADRRRLSCEDVQKEAVMRIFTKKRIVLAAAVIGLLGSVSVYAAGKMGSISHSPAKPEYTDYEQLEQAYEDAGLQGVKLPEQFTNGYEFENAWLVETADADESGAAIPGTEGREIAAEFTRQGSPEVYIYVENKQEDYIPKGNDQAVSCGDVTVYYSEDTYKFVPADYELTEEDRKNEAQSGYYISFGSSEVEVSVMKNCCWQMDGKSYNLFSKDNNMNMEEFIRMAEELIEG